MIRRVALSALLLPLSACSYLGMGDTPKVMCPQVAVVRELERTRDFGRDEPVEENLVSSVTMKGIVGQCEYTEIKLENGKYNGGDFVVSSYIEPDTKHADIFRSDKETNFYGEVDGSKEEIKKGADVEFSVDFIAEKGPRLGGNSFSVPYFVSILDPSDKILGKEVITAKFEFSGSRKTDDRQETLHVFIPTPDKDSRPEDYRVLIGFQLTEDQLKEVRAKEEKKGYTPIP